MSSTTCLYETSVTHGSLVKIRKRNAVITTVLQLLVSVAGFAISLTAYLYTNNIKAGSFWAQTAMFVAAIVLLIGILQNSEGKNWMIAGLFICGLSIFAAVIGAIIDAVQAGYILNTDFSQCKYELLPGSLGCQKAGCILSHGSRSCICCKLHVNRYCSGSVSLLNSKPTSYDGVESCESVDTEFRRYLWISCALCATSAVFGIITCALVSLYKSAVTVTIVPINGVTSWSILGASSPFIIFSSREQISYNPSGPFPPPYSIAVGQPFPPAPSTPTPPPSRNTRRINHGAGTSSSQSARSREQRRSEKQRFPPYYDDYMDEPPPPYSSPPPPSD
ncbi:transmembrane protein 255A-like [Tubulanus polymorphus]|uniref:transmembrane protein 255A-like n=1 Tax=Tubulanus polymorphus TaxID=672921 RepID=UPI003DA1EE10